MKPMKPCHWQSFFLLSVIGPIILTWVVLVFGTPAAADTIYEVPAGMACSFDLTIKTSGDWPQAEKQFFDKNGNLVRWFMAGEGNYLTFTGNGKSVSYKTGGSVSHIALHADGSMTYTMLGHNAVILFPSDYPGPAVNLYIGKVTFDVDADGKFDMVKDGSSGRVIDICAHLSQ